jgi:hypothetical protein
MVVGRPAAADGERTLPYPELLPRTIGEAPLTLTLGQLRPAIATPGTTSGLDVTLTNQGLTSTAPTLQARVGAQLTTRADLDAPIDYGATTPISDAVPVPTLAPGASATVHLTIRAETLGQGAPYGVFPLLVQAAEGPASATIRTYLPFERRKEYEPLDFSVAMPLTPDPDPALSGGSPAATEAAWSRVTATGSRLDRILAGTAGTQVTYIVDPAVLAPSPTRTAPTAPGSPAATGTGSGIGSAPATGSTTGTTRPTASTPAAPTPTPGASTTPPPSPAREAFAGRLATLASTHPIWSLPTEDPDVSELLHEDVAASTLARVVGDDGRVATRLSPASLTRVAWPHGAIGTDQVRRVAAAYGPSWTGPLVLPLADSQEPGWTGDAARKFSDGPAVLAYDETLSRLLANSAGAPASAGPGLTQRFLAETMTILQEFPGRSRRLLALAPRDVDPEPTTLAALLRTADSTPWLRTTPTDELVAATREPAAPAALAPDDAASRPDPFPSGGSPLDDQAVDTVETDLRRLDGLGQILPPDATTAVAARQAVTSLLSTRWRGQEAGWEAARTGVRTRVDGLLSGVAVIEPSPVNFFADSGTLAFTVVNGLDVDVHDVQLRLIPHGRMTRLRLPSTPYVLSIAARSRATVKVPVEALAAGPTVVSAQVTSPDGTRLGAQDATLTVQVQPSTGWLVLGIGGAAGAVFLVGLFRTIRRNRPRVSAQDLEEIDLE